MNKIHGCCYELCLVYLKATFGQVLDHFDLKFWNFFQNLEACSENKVLNASRVGFDLEGFFNSKQTFYQPQNRLNRMLILALSIRIWIYQDFPMLTIQWMFHYRNYNPSFMLKTLKYQNGIFLELTSTHSFICKWNLCTPSYTNLRMLNTS